MESRQIMIANNKTQKRYTIMSSATTLGELKAQMLEQGIDYSGMTFTEGISKTQLLSDNTQLPTNVMYKGAPTNNLVMLLTNPNKNIASGVMDRKSAYTLVKELGLAEAIKEGEGVNYTRVKTEVLEEYINIHRNGVANEELNNLGKEEGNEEVNTPTVESSKTTSIPDIKAAPHPNTVEWLYVGVKSQAKDNLLHYKDILVLSELFADLGMRLKEEEPVVTDTDIDDMFNSISH